MTATPDHPIAVAHGRRVQVYELVQRSIYASLLEGVPNRLVNERIIEDALAQARRMGQPCHLFRPHATALGRGPDQGQWTRERLPSVLCIARLVSGPIGADRDEGWQSELTVVWFQDDYAFPLSAAARSAFAALDWAAAARDVCVD